MSFLATQGVSKNRTNTQVKPWRLLAREIPRKGVDGQDKMSLTGELGDILSATGGRLIRRWLVGSYGRSLT